MVRHDYACKKCEASFILWSDEASRCPKCGSKRIFKVFITPVAFSSGQAAAVDKLAERQLEAAGLSNYTNAGGQIRRTRKTRVAELEAQAASKRYNVPLPTSPIQTGPAAVGIDAKVEEMRRNYKSMGAQGYLKAAGAQGKTQITESPRGPGALTHQIVRRARQVAPLSNMGERIYSKDAKTETVKLQSLLKR